MGAAARKLGPEWPTELHAFPMAEFINVSVRHLRDLKKKGIVFEGSRPGMYQFPESLHGYLDYKRRLAAEVGALSPLTIERAKSANVRRQIAEIELAEMQSEILTLAEVEESWKRFATGLKAAFLAVVAELKQSLPDLTDHDERTLRTLAVDALDSLADEARDSVTGVDADVLRPTDKERAGIKPRRKRI